MMYRWTAILLLVGTLAWHPLQAKAAPAKPDAAGAAEKREEQIVAATQAAIEKHRKADVKIQVVDAAGRAVPGVKVSIEQISHEFLFGGNIYMFDHCKTEAQNIAYKRRFADLLNYATVGFYWRWYEGQRGRPFTPTRTRSWPGAGNRGFA